MLEILKLQLRRINNMAKVDINLDDLIGKFKAYCQGELG